MRTALAIQQPQSLDETTRLGQLLAKSGFFADSRDAAQAVVKVLAGQELGFGPIASMTGIYVVKGRVTLSANLMAAAIKRSGRYNYRVKRLDDQACELEFFEGGQSIGVSAFTKDDARKAGTQNMDKFARNMLFARAISNGARWYCPDIFGGPVYTPDELGMSTDGDGEIIDVQPHHVNTTTGEIVDSPLNGAFAIQRENETARSIYEEVLAVAQELGLIVEEDKGDDYKALAKELNARISCYRRYRQISEAAEELGIAQATEKSLAQMNANEIKTAAATLMDEIKTFVKELHESTGEDKPALPTENARAEEWIAIGREMLEANEPAF